MDFIRATIKTAFYDYPMGSALQSIRENSLDNFCQNLPEIMRWTVPEFTTTELLSLKEVVSMQWMQKTMSGTSVVGTEMSRVFLLLNQFTKDVFANGTNPIIAFDNLLRWNALTHYIGEDILVCPYLAETDLMYGRNRLSFVWEDVLPHDNKELNRMLDGGLSDIHAHLFALSDVFAENWISLMNRAAFAKAKNKNEKATLVDIGKPYQDFDISVFGECNFLSLHHLGIVAAAIRVMLCRKLYLGVDFDYNMIVDMIKTPTLCIEKFNDVLGLIADTHYSGLRDSHDKVFDYAINRNDVGQMQDSDLSSPYMMHYGERRMLYLYFRKYYSGDAVMVELAPLVYLYILIKNKYRREFVQTNPLNGFENFKRYQDRKSLFSSHYASSVTYRYAIQSTIGRKGFNSIEGRVTQPAVRRLRRDGAGLTLFTNGQFFERTVTDNYRLVVHFIKQKDAPDPTKTSQRHSSARDILYKEMGKVLKDAKQNQAARELDKPALVGIDAAGAELNCRPELFAPYFRWAQLSGLSNFTYHAGEDFYDLVDGLRTIEEAILFMQYQRGNRIGHALALGVNPHLYYSTRHFNAIMPMQYMLDNMVWLFYKARDLNVILSPETESFIDRITHSLLRSIGYGENVHRYLYWQSMRLRGDRIDIDSKEDLMNHSYAMAAQCTSKECTEARKSETAVMLHKMYETDATIRSNGSCPDSFILPKTIADDVTKLQEAIMNQIEQRGIFIECCPSSNLVIGPFCKYEELPILRFMSIAEPYKHRINVSINTDDRGVFATSLRNEYSLMAIALSKMKDASGNLLYTSEQILEYLRKISQNAKVQRFEVPEL